MQPFEYIRADDVASVVELVSGDPEAQIKSLFLLWSVLPISRADGIMLAEEYLRFSRRLSPERKKWLGRFREWQHESMGRGSE